MSPVQDKMLNYIDVAETRELIKGVVELASRGHACFEGVANGKARFSDRSYNVALRSSDKPLRDGSTIPRIQWVRGIKRI